MLLRQVLVLLSHLFAAVRVELLEGGRFVYYCHDLPHGFPECCPETQMGIPFRCLFLSWEERKTTTGCQCVLGRGKQQPTDRVNNIELGFQHQLFEENGELWSKKDVIRASCEGKIHEQLGCFPKLPEHGRLYPPTPEALRMDSSFYCRSNNLYDNDLACWLFDCENRNQIPQETRDFVEKQPEGKGFDHVVCLPPVLPTQEHKIKYCALYTMETDVYDKRRDIKIRSPTGCVLPPLCFPNGTVDTSASVNPYVNGKEDNSYCEVLCPDTENTGTLNDGKPCRKRHVCQKDNRWQVPDEYCIDLCNENQSILKTPTILCIQRPECDKEGKAYEKFTDKNPDGVETRDCVVLPVCDEEHTADKFRCTVEPSTAGMIIGIVVGVVLVVIMTLVAVFVIYRMRKRRQDMEKAKIVEERMKVLEDEKTKENMKRDHDKDRPQGASRKKSEILRKSKETKRGVQDSKASKKGSGSTKEKKEQAEESVCEGLVQVFVPFIPKEDISSDTQQDRTAPRTTDLATGRWDEKQRDGNRTNTRSRNHSAEYTQRESMRGDSRRDTRKRGHSLN